MTYKTEWTQIDVARAETLRNRKRNKLEAIAALEQERDELTGAAKGKVTRKITPLWDEVDAISQELATLPPEPTDPNDAADYMMGVLERQERAAQNEIDGFFEQARKDLKHGFTWGAEPAFRAWLDLRVVADIKNAADTFVKEGMNRFRALQRAVDTVATDVKDRMGHDYRVFQSTCPMTNLTRAWEIEHRTELVHSGWSDLRSLQKEIAYIAKRVTAWELLNGPPQTLGDFIEEENDMA